MYGPLFLTILTSTALVLASLRYSFNNVIELLLALQGWCRFLISPEDHIASLVNHHVIP